MKKLVIVLYILLIATKSFSQERTTDFVIVIPQAKLSKHFSIQSDIN